MERLKNSFSEALERLFLFINTILLSGPMLCWCEDHQHLPRFSPLITQHQLAAGRAGWFSSPNGGMFVLTQSDTSVIDVGPAFVKHRTSARLPQRTHTHTNPGLHGDCFSAHVNLPPASVCVFVPRVRSNNYLFITAWLFWFPTQHSLSAINESRKCSGQSTTSRNKCREQTVSDFFRGT